MMTEQTTAITMREGDDAVGATSRTRMGLAPDRLVQGPTHRASAPGAYRAGNTGGITKISPS